MNRQRNVALAVIGVLVVAGFIVGQLTGGDGAGERLLASGPTTTRRPGTTAVTATTAPRGTAGTSGATGTTAAAATGGSSTSAAATSSTTAGTSAGAGAGAGGGTSTGSGSTAGTSGGAAPRNSGVSGGIEDAPVPDPGTSGRAGGGTSTETTTTTAPADPSSGSTSTTTTTTTAPGGGPQVHNLSQDDDGKTVTVKLGDLIVLRLESAAGGYWTDPVSDNAALMREALSTQDGAVLASFTAAGPGTANLTASSGQTCTTANPPCIGAPQKTIKVTITVTA